MKDRRGFTLVEIIGVIALLAAIFAVTIPTLIGVLDRSKENTYNIQIENIIKSAKAYVTEKSLTDVNLQTVGVLNTVTLNQLNLNAYIELPIKNPLTDAYFDENRVAVKIIKQSNGLYNYCFYDPDHLDHLCQDFTGEDPIITQYLVDVVSVGDFVAYDAGSWTETVAAPTSQGGFGGYTSGQNKRTSVTCYIDESGIGYPNQYSGWRVLSKSGSGSTGTVTLVHAGTPECYYHGVSGNSNASITNLNNRASSQYVNSTYATSARSINCSDVQKYDSTACSSIVTITNDMVKTGSYYWLAIVHNANHLWFVRDDGYVNYNYGFLYGLRPVVVLKSGVSKTSGTGTNADAYQISI